MEQVIVFELEKTGRFATVLGIMEGTSIVLLLPWSVENRSCGDIANHSLKQREPAVGPINIAASVRKKIATIDTCNLARHTKLLLAAD